MLPTNSISFKKENGLTVIEFDYGGSLGKSSHLPGRAADSKYLYLVLDTRRKVFERDPAEPKKEGFVSGDFRNIYSGEIFETTGYFRTGYHGSREVSCRIANKINNASLISSFAVPQYGCEYSVETLALNISGSAHNLLPDNPFPENIENSIELAKFNIDKWILSVSSRKIARSVSKEDVLNEEMRLTHQAYNEMD